MRLPEGQPQAMINRGLTDPAEAEVFDFQIVINTVAGAFTARPDC